MASIYLLGSFVYYKEQFPFKHQEIKDSISYIHENRKPEENIYVYYGSKQAFLYYKDVNFIENQVGFVIGTNNRKNKYKYLEELKALEGRNWLLFTNPHGEVDQQFIISRLDSIGYDRIHSFTANGSSAYLYDFEE